MLYSFEVRRRGDVRIVETSVAALEDGRTSESSFVSSVRLVRSMTVGARLRRLGIDGPAVDCAGVVDGCIWARFPLMPFRARMLDLLASNRLIALELGLAYSPGSRLDSLVYGEFLASGVSKSAGSLLPERMPPEPLTVGVARSNLSAERAIQSSVRLRHMLIAFRRTCRSIALVPPSTEAALCMVPCSPVLPIMAANAKLSEAVASNARYTSGLI